jgi:hypothetical protein
VEVDTLIYREYLRLFRGTEEARNKKVEWIVAENTDKAA